MSKTNAEIVEELVNSGANVDATDKIIIGCNIKTALAEKDKAHKLEMEGLVEAVLHVPQWEDNNEQHNLTAIDIHNKIKAIAEARNIKIC